MNKLSLAILVFLVLLDIVALNSMFAVASEEIEHDALHEADHHHESDKSDEGEHDHHAHTHKAASDEKAQLRKGEIVFSVVFCLCLGLIIYLAIKRRWT